MYTVRCRNAAGTAREISLRADSTNSAIQEALAELESHYPGQGWVPEFVL